MPIKVAQGLPAIEQLMDEGVNVIRETKALKQDIRPLRIAILNLMPLKETTEMQFLRLIGGSPLQIEVDFLHTQTYKSKNVSSNHLEQFYKTFEEIEDFFYDGLIITGAPVEQIAFEEVDYYDELIKILKCLKQMSILDFLSVGQHRFLQIIIMELKESIYQRNCLGFIPIHLKTQIHLIYAALMTLIQSLSLVIQR